MELGIASGALGQDANLPFAGEFHLDDILCDEHVLHAQNACLHRDAFRIEQQMPHVIEQVALPVNGTGFMLNPGAARSENSQGPVKRAWISFFLRYMPLAVIRRSVRPPGAPR